MRAGEIGAVGGAPKPIGASGSALINSGIPSDAARAKNDAKGKLQKIGNAKSGKFKNQGDANPSGKSPIELAREKFAAAKIKKDSRQRGIGKATGANAI